MDPDMALLAGMGLLILSLPSAIAALAESRAPRVAAVTMVTGGALIVHAVRSRPGGYTWEEIPIVIYSMVAAVRDTIF